MLDKKNKGRVDCIIRSEIGIDPVTIDADKPIRQQISLDSMQFVGLVARIEIEFKTELPVTILQVDSLREFYSEISKAIGNGDAGGK